MARTSSSETLQNPNLENLDAKTNKKYRNQKKISLQKTLQHPNLDGTNAKPKKCSRNRKQNSLQKTGKNPNLDIKNVKTMKKSHKQKLTLRPSLLKKLMNRQEEEEETGICKSVCVLASECHGHGSSYENRFAGSLRRATSKNNKWNLGRSSAEPHLEEYASKALKDIYHDDSKESGDVSSSPLTLCSELIPGDTDEKLRSLWRQQGHSKCEDDLKLVGKRIDVYWPMDCEWYSGSVKSYNSSRNQHKVCYDDGDEEWLNLSNEKFRFQSAKNKIIGLKANKPESLSNEQIQNDVQTQNGVKQNQSNQGKSNKEEKQKNEENCECVAEESELISSSMNHQQPNSNWHMMRSSSATIDSPLQQSKLSLSLPRKGASSSEDQFPCLITNGESVQPDLNMLNFSLQKNQGNDFSFMERSLSEAETVIDINESKVKCVYVRKHKNILKQRPQIANGVGNRDSKDDDGVEGVGIIQQEWEDRESKRRNPKLFRLQLDIENVNMIDSENNATEDQFSSTINGRSLKKRKHLCSGGRARKKGRLSLLNLIGRKNVETLSSPNSNVETISNVFSPEASRKRGRKYEVKNLFHNMLPEEEACNDLGEEVVGGWEQTIYEQDQAIYSSLCDNIENKRATKMPYEKQYRRNLNGVDASNRGLKIANLQQRKLHEDVQEHTSSLLSNGEMIGIITIPGEKVLDLLNHNGEVASFEAFKFIMKHQQSTIMIPVKSIQGQEMFLKLNHMTRYNQRLKILSGQYAIEPKFIEFMLHISCMKVFYTSIHLLRIDLIHELFTWQLFNILKAIGLCRGDNFEERFVWYASAQEFLNIALLLMASIKSLPLISHRSQRHWQSRILNELWVVLYQRKQWQHGLSGVLPTKTYNLLRRNLRLLITQGRFIVTFREMFNIFISYVIKPYVIMILCGKGAHLSVLVEKFMLNVSSKDEGILCERTHVKLFELRSNAGAESDFYSHLSVFPFCKIQHTGNKILQNSMRKWITSAMRVGFVRLPPPAPSVKFLKHWGCEIMTALVFNKSLASMKKNNHDCGPSSRKFFVSFEKLISNGSKLAEETRDGFLNGVSGNSCSSMDSFSELCFTSKFHKYLDLGGNLGDVSVYAVGDCVPGFTMSNETQQNDSCETVNTGGASSSNSKKEKEKFSCASSFSGVAVVKECLIENNDTLEASHTTDVSPREDYYIENTCRDIKGSEENCTTSVLSEHTEIGIVKDKHGHEFGRNLVQNTSRDSCTSYSPNQMIFKGSRSNSSFESYTEPRSFGRKELGFRKSKRDRSAKKEFGSGGCSHIIKDKSTDCEPSNLCCIANVLVTNGDRSLRELGANIKLVSKETKWLLSVEAGGMTYCHKVLETSVTSKVNRHTHALMWKGGEEWTLEFCDRKEWSQFKRMHEECGHRNARAACMKQIPIPEVRIIEGIHEATLPTGSILHETSDGLIQQTQGEIEDALESSRIVYDMDSEDEAWLEELNRETSSIVDTSVEKFERIIDKLERESYLREGRVVSSEEAVELCQNISSIDTVRAIHGHWSHKRLAKDSALIRYFQLPLWEKYQKQFESWRMRFNELQSLMPSASKEKVLGQCPRPPMFAFCLPPKKSVSSNVNKRMQRQHPQKDTTNRLIKCTRATSIGTSGFLQKNNRGGIQC